MADNTFTPDPILQAAIAEGERRMGAAVLRIKGEVQRLLNVGNPTGKFPSRPGEPPRKVSARLFFSIASGVATDGAVIIGRVGTNVVYARRLELGFSGRDSLGRHYDQAPRPFLRPGLFNTKDAVGRDLGVAPDARVVP